MSKRPTDPMIEVDKKHRVRNSARVEKIREENHFKRLEPDRHTDLPLITLCLRRNPPEHVRQVHPGIFAVDLPADVWKAVFITDGGYWVGTYATKLDRAEDL